MNGFVFPFLILSVLFCQFSMAGVGDADFLERVQGDRWRVECSDGTVGRATTEDILNDSVCGESSTDLLCIEVAKENLSHTEYNSIEELRALNQACGSGGSGMGKMLQAMIEQLSFTQYNSNEEMVELIGSAAPGGRKGRECLTIAFNHLSSIEYNSQEEMALLASSCGRYRSSREIACYQSSLDSLPPTRFNSVEEMTEVINTCR